MLAELSAISWRVRERGRVREFASSHRLEQMRRLWMLEEQEVWEREVGFDRIAIIAKMNVQTLRRLHASFDSGTLYTGLYTLGGCPHLTKMRSK